MISQLQLRAPAKVNRFLHIVGQRPDGYHLLQTVFQLIDLEDHITLDCRADGTINRTNGPDNVKPEDDLVKIGRAHVCTPVTSLSRMPSSA